MIVREREISVVLRYTFPREPEGGYAVLDAAADVVDVLWRIEQRRVVAADPGVHHEGPAVRLIDPPEHSIGLRLKRERIVLFKNFINSSSFVFFFLQGEVARNGPLSGGYFSRQWNIGFNLRFSREDIGYRSGLEKRTDCRLIWQILTMLLSSENPTPVHILVFVVEITNDIRSCGEKFP